MVKNAFILIMVTLTIVKDSNMLPGYLNVILHIVVGFIALASDVFVFKFYGSLPDFKKSVLTYTVRLLVVASGIAVVWYNLAAIILEFSFFISPWVAEYPNTCCTLLRVETVSEVMLVAIIMIQLCKACIVFNSLFFLSMDHERVFKFILVIVLVIFMTHNSLALFFAGTLCPLPKLSRILRLNKIKVPEEMKKTAPPLIFIYFIITFLATIILKFVKRIKNKNQSINPVVPQNFPTISGMPKNLKKNSIHPTNMNITANTDERNQPSQFVPNVERNDPETAANDQPVTSAQISGPRNENIKVKMNLTVLACLSITLATFFSMQSDTTLFLFLLESSVSLAIHILPITRLLRLDDTVSYAKRKLIQLFKGY